MLKVTLPVKSSVHAAILAAGGPSALAAALKVSRPTIDKWRKRGWFPEHRLSAVIAATGLPESIVRGKRNGKR